MNVIVAGSRTFNDYALLKKKLDYFFLTLEDITIISGTAKGTDDLGERYALENRYNLIRMPADWDKYGKSAGYRRNKEMALIAQCCVLFWDFQSSGTRHMRDIAIEHNLKLRIVKI